MSICTETSVYLYRNAGGCPSGVIRAAAAVETHFGIRGTVQLDKGYANKKWHPPQLPMYLAVSTHIPLGNIVAKDSTLPIPRRVAGSGPQYIHSAFTSLKPLRKG